MWPRRSYKAAAAVASPPILEVSPLGCATATGDYASLVQHFHRLRRVWSDDEDDHHHDIEETITRSFTSSTSLLRLQFNATATRRIRGQKEEAKSKTKSRAIMACMNALCRRLKRIFSRGGESSAAAAAATAPTSGVGKVQQQANGGNAEQSLAINFNRFAPLVDDDELIVDQIDRDKRGKRRKKKRKNGDGLPIKILRFNATESTSTHSLSVSLSIEAIDASLLSTTTTTTPLTRYERDFQELGLVGRGAFGAVYRCVNRLDGCLYAVKRSKPLARSSYAQRRALNEVHANAVLIGLNENVVRYYSAWMEENRMSIQQEFCNGGDLAEVIELMRREGRVFEEPALKRLLYHVANGLKYIHGLKLAHMDIKPDNIFISKKRSLRSITSSEDSGNSSKDNDTEEVVYKIGDLGHITSVDGTEEIEDEGDCRYLPKEILREEYKNLTKADVFALGLTVYEAGGGGPLPKNGRVWHDIRDGKLTALSRYGDTLNDLMKMMVHPEPSRRPSAADLVRNQFSPINGSDKSNKWTDFGESM